MPELRLYQQELLARAETALQPPNARLMLQLPTGGGKTHIAAALLSRWLQNGRQAAWLTHRVELADQTSRMLSESGVSAASHGNWRAGNNAPFIANGAVILMAQTVGRRTSNRQIWGEYNSDDLLIIDEAHHATAKGWARAINQWPGQVVGLTATPWRLSVKEGFNHLFTELYCGPQVSQLQAEGWLCQAEVFMPQPQDIIRGGPIAYNGDYNESGIERANQDRPGVMTAGVLNFWQTRAAGRQTVIYAISKEHARNLEAVFSNAGIPATVMLGDTPSQERAEAIKSFGNRTLRVLINVTVATEGFDLPDASCIVLTRPTMSLALYLQMVGRGLRLKPDGGNCLILDLAGNAKIHGLPAETREWSLFPRGSGSTGDAPVVWCENCNGVSHAASHFCQHCRTPLGKDCGRCGKWRAFQRWSLADGCAIQHEIVCNFCHMDAHIEANLPSDKDIIESAIDPLLFTLVNGVRQRLLEANTTRLEELNKLIPQRKQENSNNADLDRLFDEYLTNLPSEEQPANPRAIAKIYNSWETTRQKELDCWLEELSCLESNAAVENKVRQGCNEQITDAEKRPMIWGVFSESQGVEKTLKIIEQYKINHNTILVLNLQFQEMEKISWMSRIKNILQGQSDTGKYSVQRREFDNELNQLDLEVDQAVKRRLTHIKRQFESHWTAIWTEYQQS